MIAGARFDRERMRAAASDELIAATDVADLLVRARDPLPRGARRRRGARAHGARQRHAALGADTARSSPRHSAMLAEHASEYAAVLAQSSWLESKVSEGGTSLGARARAARAGAATAAR